MANLYDVCNLVFENDTHRVEHNYRTNIQDFEDYIEIETELVFDIIDRGWIGNITFNFDGYDVKNAGYNDEHRLHMHVMLKDLLCARRTFYKDGPNIVRWKYVFLKY